MRHGIHPVSRPIVFRDRAAGFQFLTRSTLDSDRTVEWGRSDVLLDLVPADGNRPYDMAKVIEEIVDDGE
ncbi:hypothetical protein ACWDU9_29960, partial [Streptomyces cellulosae]